VDVSAIQSVKFVYYGQLIRVELCHTNRVGLGAAMIDKKLETLQTRCNEIARDIWDMTPVPYRVDSWENHLKILIKVGHYEMLKAIHLELEGWQNV